MIDFEKLQKKINYIFKDKLILTQALTHKSYLNETNRKSCKDNERYEFLGDAVLDLVISTELLNRFPDEKEGKLSRMKARLVNETSLARVARSIDLGLFLLLGKGEEVTNGREKNSLLADVLEALIAGIFLDSGLEAATTFIMTNFKLLFDQLLRVDSLDYKSKIQEISQVEYSILPSYTVIRKYGPDHQKIFEVAIAIHDIIYAIGIGKTKKDAEQSAARMTLEKLLLKKEQKFI